jgi:hypothetical protein
MGTGWALATLSDQQSHEEGQHSNPNRSPNWIVQHPIEDGSELGRQRLHLTCDTVHGLRNAAAQRVRDRAGDFLGRRQGVFHGSPPVRLLCDALPFFTPMLPGSLFLEAPISTNNIAAPVHGWGNYQTG